jgi:hypothetical protein
VPISRAAESTRDVAQEDFLFHLYRGSELLQDSRVLEAKEELEFALTMQPSDPKGQDLLGAVYFRLGLYPRAIQIYETLANGFQNDVSIKINLALCYLKTGQPEPARRTLQDATRINPEHRRAWGYLGLALQKLGELEQAQIAFERGGHPMMARRVSERRQRVTVPAPIDGGAGIDEGVRSVAEAAFSELDAGELRFALAEPTPPKPVDGPWHAVEPGDAARPLGRRSYPPPQLASAPPADWVGPPPLMPQPSLGEASTRLVPPAPTPEMDAAVVLPPLSSAPPAIAVPVLTTARADANGNAGPHARQRADPNDNAAPHARALAATRATAIFDEGAGPAVALHRLGAIVRIHEDKPFAAKLEALRLVAGPVTTRVLHRRVRDTDTGEVLGGIGSPMVLLAGSAQLLLAPRAGCTLVPIELAGELAFVREDLLLGFEMRVAYENGRLALESSPEGPRSDSGQSNEASAVVQLRGTGTALLELPGALATVACIPGRPLLVRRDWIVGWLGRLVSRAIPAAEAPSGQRGLIAFSGEGTVLVGG